MPFEPFYGRKVLALSPTILSLDHQQTEKERAFRLGAQTALLFYLKEVWGLQTQCCAVELLTVLGLFWVCPVPHGSHSVL